MKAKKAKAKAKASPRTWFERHHASAMKNPEYAAAFREARTEIAAAGKPRRSKVTRIAGVPVETVDFFASVPGRSRVFSTYCPFCDKTVSARKKAYLMVCTACGMRID